MGKTEMFSNPSCTTISSPIGSMESGSLRVRSSWPGSLLLNPLMRLRGPHERGLRAGSGSDRRCPLSGGAGRLVDSVEQGLHVVVRVGPVPDPAGVHGGDVPRRPDSAGPAGRRHVEDPGRVASGGADSRVVVEAGDSVPHGADPGRSDRP